MRSLEPTPDEVRRTEIPADPWIEPYRRRMGTGNLRERLARERKLKEVMEPVLRHPDGLADRRAEVRLLGKLVGAAGLAGVDRRNFERIDIQRREWRLPGLPRSFDGFRILHASDFHVDFDPGVIDRLRRVVSGLDYDLACLTGDFCDLAFDEAGVKREWIAELAGLFRGPVRAVPGNHDILRVAALLEESGVRVLLNEREESEGFVLAGLDDPRHYRNASFAKALDGAPPGLPRVALVHAPQIYREAAAHGIDLVLCGHTHGGQVRLPGGIPLSNRFACPRRMVSRDWKFRSVRGYTSNGCGGCKLPFRLNAPAEVAVHTLRPA